MNSQEQIKERARCRDIFRKDSLQTFNDIQQKISPYRLVCINFGEATNKEVSFEYVCTHAHPFGLCLESPYHYDSLQKIAYIECSVSRWYDISEDDHVSYRTLEELLDKKMATIYEAMQNCLAGVIGKA